MQGRRTGRCGIQSYCKACPLAPEMWRPLRKAPAAGSCVVAAGVMSDAAASGVLLPASM